jgi:hypothetical protein
MGRSQISFVPPIAAILGCPLPGHPAPKHNLAAALPVLCNLHLQGHFQHIIDFTAKIAEVKRENFNCNRYGLVLDKVDMVSADALTIEKQRS